MRTDASRPFEECVLAVAGIQDGNKPTPMLSSLACELTFNKLRDTAKRHRKADKCSPAAMHSVSWKASAVHNFGCQPLALSDSDWSEKLKKGQVKRAVHSALRATDVSLGISAEGLTKHRNSKHFTKPHVFGFRLQLLECLASMWNESVKPIEDKRVDILKSYDKMWLSKVCPELWFVRFTRDTVDDHPDESLIVCLSGPFTLRCLKVHKQDGVYMLDRDPLCSLVVDSLDKCQFARSAATVTEDNGSLAWVMDTPWMKLTEYIAEYSILTISTTLLLAVCSMMNLKTKGLDHRHRVEYFLKHMGKSDEFVENVLTLLPPPRTRKRKTGGGDGDAEQAVWGFFMWLLVSLIHNFMLSC